MIAIEKYHIQNIFFKTNYLPYQYTLDVYQQNCKVNVNKKFIPLPSVTNILQTVNNQKI